jgi:Na+-transporting NADH:ubiquinone oxidoreductase subunit NqrE
MLELTVSVVVVQGLQSNLLTPINWQVWRNDEKHGGVVSIDNSWAFGQILSVVMIIGSLYEIVHVFVDRLISKRAHSGGLQVGTEEASQKAEEHPAAVS